MPSKRALLVVALVTLVLLTAGLTVFRPDIVAVTLAVVVGLGWASLFVGVLSLGLAAWIDRS
jgi:hypothetical protein